MMILANVDFTPYASLVTFLKTDDVIKLHSLKKTISVAPKNFT